MRFFSKAKTTAAAAVVALGAAAQSAADTVLVTFSGTVSEKDDHLNQLSDITVGDLFSGQFIIDRSATDAVPGNSQIGSFPGATQPGSEIFLDGNEIGIGSGLVSIANDLAAQDIFNFLAQESASNFVYSNGFPTGVSASLFQFSGNAPSSSNVFTDDTLNNLDNAGSLSSYFAQLNLNAPEGLVSYKFNIESFTVEPYPDDTGNENSVPSPAAAGLGLVLMAGALSSRRWGRTPAPEL